MAIPTIDAYTGQLPDTADPSTFDGRASSLWPWYMGSLAQLNVSIAKINTALNGDATQLAAVASLTAQINGFGGAAGYDVSTEEAFTTAAGQIPTRAAVAAYVKPTYFVKDLDVLGDQSSLIWTGLSGFRRIRLNFLGVNMTADSSVRHLQFSKNNGASWLTSGYDSRTGNDNSYSTSTTGVRLNDAESTWPRMGFLECDFFNSPAIDTVCDGIVSVAKVHGRHTVPAAHNAIRLITTAGKYTGGKVVLSGYR